MARRIFFTPPSVSQLSDRFIAILAYPKFLIVHNAHKGRTSPLTLILLTWRIWRAPSNASRWQMGFNSSFKG